jgi:hypothetical protein
MATLREQLLKMTKDAKQALSVPFKVKKDKKTLETWLIGVEEKIANLEFKINELKGADNFDPEKILDSIDDLELAKRRFKQGELLLENMFEENAETPSTEG